MCALRRKSFQDRNGKRSAFGWIRSRSKFVQQHERAASRFFNQIYRILHMRGKGTQALLNALLIADIREDFPINRKAAGRRRRNMKPTLRHHRQKSCGFQCNSLSSRIRSGNDKRLILFSNGQIYRDNFFRFNQWVSGKPQIKETFLVYARLFRLHFARKLSLREDDVQLNQNFLVID